MYVRLSDADVADELACQMHPNAVGCEGIARRAAEARRSQATIVLLAAGVAYYFWGRRT